MLTPRWPMRAIGCAHFALPIQRTGCDGLVYGRSVPFARGGGDYALVPSGSLRRYRPTFHFVLLSPLDHLPYVELLIYLVSRFGAVMFWR